MFEGGTNFGFMNGSNYYDDLTPDVTSYDYDALLTEDGQITEKYRRYRDVIAKYREIPEVTFTTEIKRKAYGTLPVKEKVSLFSVLDDLSTPVESSFPQSMEKQNKPVMITEYGADAVAGIHECVPEMFSEEFQVEFYKRQNAQFDKR